MTGAILRCRKCGQEIHEGSKASTVFEDVSVTLWMTDDLRSGCRRGGPHEPDVKLQVTDSEADDFLRSLGG